MDIIDAFLVAMLLLNVLQLTKIFGDRLIYQAPLHLLNFPSVKKVTKQHFQEPILHKVGSLDALNVIKINSSTINMAQENADNVNLLCVLIALVQGYLISNN